MGQRASRGSLALVSPGFSRKLSDERKKALLNKDGEFPRVLITGKNILKEFKKLVMKYPSPFFSN